MQNFCQVAVPAPMWEALTYSIPPELQGLVSLGQVVVVPLGTRQATGIVMGFASKPDPKIPFESIKDIASIDELYSPLPKNFIDWIDWLSQYYVYPLGYVAQSALPPLKPLTSKPRKSNKAPVVAEKVYTTPPALTPEQTKVLAGIEVSQKFKTHLLFGVTGSGKTEVYLRLIEKCLALGKSALVLVPEISLTPQLMDRFSSRFGAKIAAIHSQLTEREKTNQWWQFINGEKEILVGARSALFCPHPNIGLIIVDEEHEPSYKQDEKLKYHARDAAIMLAKFSQCPIILGSATPSLESYKNALEGKFLLHEMRSRVDDIPLPNVEIVDLRELNNPAKEKSATPKLEIPAWLSPALYEAMVKTLENRKQVALFLNRRGLASVVLCRACGYVEECPNCDIALTLHHQKDLVCHYCDYHKSHELSCMSCKEGELVPVGLGTEMVEKEISALFPGARVARVDRDEIQNREDLEDFIQKMENHEIDILIGTQMIAKGLDFKNLNLVGLLLADIGFNLPDFRATERSFQLLTQMSGRAGRHSRTPEDQGQVFIQTYNPEHPSVVYSLKADYQNFSLKELETRAALNYPPYGQIILFKVSGLKKEAVERTAEWLRQRWQKALEQKQVPEDEIEVLGPAQCAIFRLRNQFRYQLLAKSVKNTSIKGLTKWVLGDQKWVPSGVRISVDVDPYHLL